MTQLDRIEERLQAIDDRTRAIEIKIEGQAGEKRGEGRAAKLVHHAVTALIAALAGFGGGKLPGLH